MPKKSLSIKIAGIVIKVESAIDFKRFDDLGFYRDFITAKSADPHCLLDHKIAPPPDLEPAGSSFSPLNAWQLFKTGHKNVLRVGPSPRNGKPENITVFGDDYAKGEMYQSGVGELFRGFIDQFLIINLLSRNNGFLLHASGVVWEGKGLCFSGPSGAGKSTLLNMFKEEVKREHLLNDDRLALRMRGNKWRVFGTPWYGESRVSSSNEAPLSALFFIRHSEHNYARKLAASEIPGRLMAQALIPLWDGEAVSRVLGTFQDLISNIPVFEMGFVPDKSAIEMAKKAI